MKIIIREQVFMNRHTQLHQRHLTILTPEMQFFLNKIKDEPKRTERRHIMPYVVSLMRVPSRVVRKWTLKELLNIKFM